MLKGIWIELGISLYEIKYGVLLLFEVLFRIIQIDKMCKDQLRYPILSQ